MCVDVVFHRYHPSPPKAKLRPPSGDRPATHLLETGADVRCQMLLGHAYLESTASYLHLTTARLRQVPSPIDLIGTDKGKPLG